MASDPKPATAFGVFEAKNRLSELLDRVERGESILITRHGRAIAHLVPANAPRDQARIERAIEGLRELRKGTSLGGLTIRELIDEGRK